MKKVWKNINIKCINIIELQFEFYQRKRTYKTQILSLFQIQQLKSCIILIMMNIDIILLHMVYINAVINMIDKNYGTTKILTILCYQEKLIVTLLANEQLYLFLHWFKAEMYIFKNIQKLFESNDIMQSYIQIELIYVIGKKYTYWEQRTRRVQNILTCVVILLYL